MKLIYLGSPYSQPFVGIAKVMVDWLDKQGWNKK